MTKGEEYLKLYPGLAKKWLVQCIGCQQKGFRPEMPTSPDSFSFQNLRQYFKVNLILSVFVLFAKINSKNLMKIQLFWPFNLNNAI